MEDDDEATCLLHQTIAEHGWRACTACRRVIELSLGCHHIICPCGHKFCYLCGQRWKTCACDQWDEENLLIAQEAGEILFADAPGPGGGQLPAEQLGFIMLGAGPVDVIEADIAHRRAEDESARRITACHHARFRWVRGPHDCGICEHRLRDFVYQCRGSLLMVCARCRQWRIVRLPNAPADEAGRGPREDLERTRRRDGVNRGEARAFFQRAGVAREGARIRARAERRRELASADMVRFADLAIGDQDAFRKDAFADNGVDGMRLGAVGAAAAPAAEGMAWADRLPRAWGQGGNWADMGAQDLDEGLEERLFGGRRWDPETMGRVDGLAFEQDGATLPGMDGRTDTAGGSIWEG